MSVQEINDLCYEVYGDNLPDEVKNTIIDSPDIGDVIYKVLKLYAN